MAGVQVELLVSEACSTRAAAVAAVLRAGEEAGVIVALTERVVETEDEARSLRMPGSPTVRVEGRDVEPGAEAREDFGLG